MPSESIWVAIHSTSSNLKVNDEGAKIFADDSTDGGGLARITIPSFSGNGTIALGLTVSGKFQGNKSATVRTTDTNADGRSDAADATGYSDINYSGGTPNGADLSIILQHSNPKHWHRNVLFGTLVKRTNACPTCIGIAPGKLGDNLAWAPNGNMIALSLYDDSLDCTMNIVPADAAVGSLPFRISNPIHPDHDYDPGWTPDGRTIYWNRADYYMM